MRPRLQHTNRGSWCGRTRPLHILLLAIIVLATVGHRPAGADDEWSLVYLKTGEPACLSISGGERVYYRVDEPLEFNLYGPRDLRLYSRHLPRGGVNVGRRTYTLVVERDGKMILLREIFLGRAEGATLCEDTSKFVGESALSTVIVPDGKHAFRVSVEERGKAVAVRLLAEERRQDEPLMCLVPDQYSRTFTLLRQKSGNAYEHYCFDQQQPLRFTIFGPADIQVLARLDIPTDAPADQEYSFDLEIVRNGESLRTESFLTERLEDDIYRETDRYSPSQSEQFDLEVPSGEWTYELRLTAPEDWGATARVLIPKSQITPR